MDKIEKFKAQCEILKHKKSGARTKDAMLALSEKSSNIIKCILLRGRVFNKS